MFSNVPEESLHLKRVGLISFLITELHLLRVCNPLARSAGVFLRVFNDFLAFLRVLEAFGPTSFVILRNLRKSGTFITVLRKSGTFIKLLGLHTIEQGCSVT